jgi:hypothetical protein
LTALTSATFLAELNKLSFSTRLVRNLAIAGRC